MKVKKKTTENRSIFVAKYDPRIPSLEPIVAKHWRAMKSQDKYPKDCFTQPPLIGFRRQANIRDLLMARVSHKLSRPGWLGPVQRLNKKSLIATR